MGLFEGQVSRKPDHYPEAQKFIDSIWTGFWTPNEFNFRQDITDFKAKLTEEERGVVVRALSAIGQIEIAVKTFWSKLGTNLPHPSITDLGFVMANSEVIHNLAYEKLLIVLGLEEVFEQNLKEGVVADRVTYLRKYLERTFWDDRKQYIYAITLFTLFVENVSLFSQFYILMHFNRYKGVLKDTAQQIQYTRNEEVLHSEVGIWLITTLRKEYPELFDKELEDRIVEETQSALEAEYRVVDWIMGDYNQDDLSAEVLKVFIKERMASSLERSGFDSSGLSLNTRENELLRLTTWMEDEIYSPTHTDFFHKKPVDYAKSNQSFDVGSLF